MTLPSLLILAMLGCSEGSPADELVDAPGKLGDALDKKPPGKAAKSKEADPPPAAEPTAPWAGDALPGVEGDDSTLTRASFQTDDPAAFTAAMESAGWERRLYEEDTLDDPTSTWVRSDLFVAVDATTAGTLVIHTTERPAPVPAEPSDALDKAQKVPLPNKELVHEHRCTLFGKTVTLAPSNKTGLKGTIRSDDAEGTWKGNRTKFEFTLGDESASTDRAKTWQLGDVLYIADPDLVVPCVREGDPPAVPSWVMIADYGSEEGKVALAAAIADRTLPGALLTAGPGSVRFKGVEVRYSGPETRESALRLVSTFERDLGLPVTMAATAKRAPIEVIVGK